MAIYGGGRANGIEPSPLARASRKKTQTDPLPNSINPPEIGHHNWPPAVSKYLSRPFYILPRFAKIDRRITCDFRLVGDEITSPAVTRSLRNDPIIRQTVEKQSESAYFDLKRKIGFVGAIRRDGELLFAAAIGGGNALGRRGWRFFEGKRRRRFRAGGASAEAGQMDRRPSLSAKHGNSPGGTPFVFSPAAPSS